MVAVILVALAAVLDLLDGAAARHKGAEGEFGANLDSLADIVSFGIAPALLLFLGASGGLLATQVCVGISCAVFVVCGAVRLARFPLVKSPDHFVGLPIPPAGVAVALLTVLVSPVLAAPVVLVLSWSMVCRFRFPSPNALARPPARGALREEVGDEAPDAEPSINSPRNG